MSDYWSSQEVEIEQLRGNTFKSVIRSGNEILFETVDGNKIVMAHSQSCCESVDIEDVCGDLSDLVNSPILLAEKVTNNENPKIDPDDSDYTPESYTWTFYKLGTVKGIVTFRWYGTSNGYYSEEVELLEVK